MNPWLHLGRRIKKNNVWCKENGAKDKLQRDRFNNIFFTNYVISSNRSVIG